MIKKILFTSVLSIIFLSSNITFAQDNEGYPHGVLSSNGKRFVLGQISQLARDQYMLDTETGRLWQIVQGEKGNTVLQMVPYVMLNGGLSLVAPSAENEVKSIPPATENKK